MERLAKEVRAIHDGLEPQKPRINAACLAALYARSPILLRALDDVRTNLIETKVEDVIKKM